MDSQILVQTDRIEKKISALYPGYGGYVSGSIVVLMSYDAFLAELRASEYSYDAF